MATKKKTKSYRSKYQTEENNDVEDLETDAPEGVSDLDEESYLDEESEVSDADIGVVLERMAEAVRQKDDEVEKPSVIVHPEGPKQEPENFPSENKDVQKPSVPTMQTAKKLGLISREKSYNSRKYFPNRTRH